MKKLGRIVVILLVVLVVAVLTSNFYLGSVVKTAVEKVGPRVMGVPITLEAADFHLIRGLAELEGLVIGNPEGFDTPSSIELGKLTVELVPKSLLSDTIIIKNIHVSEPKVTFEQGLTGNNIGALTKNLSGGDKKAEEEPKEEKEGEPAEVAAKSGKKVVIKYFKLEKGQVKLSVKGMRGAAAPVPLPTLELENIGESSGGTSIDEAVTLIFSAISQSILSTASGSVKLVGKGAMKTGELAMDGAAKTVDVAGDAVSGTASAAGDAAKATGKAAGDAAKATGKAVGEGASKIIGGVGGLLGGGKKDESADKGTSESE